MNRKMLSALVCVSLSLCSAHGQLVQEWNAVESGSGMSIGDSLNLLSSVGAQAVQSVSGPGFTLEGGFIPGVRHLCGSTSCVEIEIEGSWNMVSVPLAVCDCRKSALYPEAASNAFGYADGYRVVDSLVLGAGYWMKFASNFTKPLLGSTVISESIDVAARWNIIAGPSYPLAVGNVVAVNPIGITSFLYGYSGAQGYFRSDTLMPGKSYWVKVSGKGKLSMNAALPFHLIGRQLAGRGEAVVPRIRAGTMTEEQQRADLIFASSDGEERTLHFAGKQSRLEPGSYELPPLPPEGNYDVRFESGRSLEIAESTEARTCGILVSSGRFPLTVRWSNREDLEAWLFVNGKEIPLRDRGSVEVRVPSPLKLRLGPTSGRSLPREFALSQNYPNPFNPTTVIDFQVPIASHVRLIVYDVLGREIATLVDEVRQPGVYSATWDAREAASGVYFYRFSSEKFNTVKKMVLLK